MKYERHVTVGYTDGEDFWTVTLIHDEYFEHLTNDKPQTFAGVHKSRSI